MKGSKCFLCDGLVETDNEDCLCNNCLSSVNKPDPVSRAILMVVIIIVGVVLISVL